MVYELYDISFFIKCLKHPTAFFNIMNYIKFSLAAQDQVHVTSWFIHLSKQTNQNTFALIDCQGYGTHCLLLIWIRVTTLLWTASKLTSGITSWTILMIISHARSISAAHATHVAVLTEWTSILSPKYVVMLSIMHMLSLLLSFTFCQTIETYYSGCYSFIYSRPSALML